MYGWVWLFMYGWVWLFMYGWVWFFPVTAPNHTYLYCSHRNWSTLGVCWWERAFSRSCAERKPSHGSSSCSMTFQCTGILLSIRKRLGSWFSLCTHARTLTYTHTYTPRLNYTHTHTHKFILTLANSLRVFILDLVSIHTKHAHTKHAHTCVSDADSVKLCPFCILMFTEWTGSNWPRGVPCEMWQLFPCLVPHSPLSMCRAHCRCQQHVSIGLF